MVYVDSKGFRVDIVNANPDRVSFCPQGGGFVYSVPTETFHASFKPAATPGFRRASFSGDWNETPVRGFSDGNRWNGWAMPYFEFDTAQAIAAEFEGEDSTLRYQKDIDAFIYTSANCPDAPEAYAGTWIDIEGKPMKVYPIGAGSWCWYEESNDE